MIEKDWLVVGVDKYVGLPGQLTSANPEEKVLPFGPRALLGISGEFDFCDPAGNRIALRYAVDWFLNQQKAKQAARKAIRNTACAGLSQIGYDANLPLEKNAKLLFKTLSACAKPCSSTSRGTHIGLAAMSDPKEGPLFCRFTLDGQVNLCTSSFSTPILFTQGNDCYIRLDLWHQGGVTPVTQGWPVPSIVAAEADKRVGDYVRHQLDRMTYDTLWMDGDPAAPQFQTDLRNRRQEDPNDVRVWRLDVGGRMREPDVVPPISKIESPSQGAIVVGSTCVVAYVLEGMDMLREVRLVVDTRDEIEASDSGDYKWVFQWDTSRWSNGEHALSVRAMDRAANVQSSPDVIVKVANAVEPEVLLTFDSLPHRVIEQGEFVAHAAATAYDAGGKPDLSKYRVRLVAPPNLFANVASPAALGNLTPQTCNDARLAKGTAEWKLQPKAAALGAFQATNLVLELTDLAGTVLDRRSRVIWLGSPQP